MNTGAISVRYATALLKYVEETGRGAEVCAQVQAMLKDPDNVPNPLEPDLVRFIQLLSDHGRLDYLKLIFHSFVKLYLESKGIRTAVLTTVIPSPETGEKIKKLLEARLGCEVLLETRTDPSIIGGFVLEVDDYMLDASVSSQLETIRRQFVADNTRLV